MNYAKKIDAAPVLYSCCSGHNFYFSDDLRQHEVFGKPKRIIEHVKTGLPFYVTPFPDDLNNDFELEYWVELIRKPVILKHFIWPVDVIALPTEDGRDRYALVFPIRALVEFESVETLLSDNTQQAAKHDVRMGWDKKWVKEFVSELLLAWCHFDDSNYAYHEFSVENIFRQKDKHNVLFDFSFSTQKAEDLYSTRFVNKKRINPDYADSFYYLDERESLMDMASNYYSIAVVLFKLLIGRLPYQGKVMTGEPNETEGEHKNWIKIYHKRTYFIFDEKDHTNRIGGETGFANDDTYVERWNELPQHVRNMFHNVFQAANVLRRADELIFYSPKQWKEALFGEVKDVALVYREVKAAPPKPVKEPAAKKPVKAPVDEPIGVPFETLSSEQIVEMFEKSRNNPVVEPVEMPISEPVEMSFGDPIVDPDINLDEMPIGDPIVDPDIDLTEMSFSEPIIDLDIDPIEMPISEPVDEPIHEPTSALADEIPFAEGSMLRAAVEQMLLSGKKEAFYDVILTAAAPSGKIVTIKVVREITGLGLKAAKDLVESAPSPIVQGVSLDTVKKIQAELNLIGAETSMSVDVNGVHNEEVERGIVERMQERWQSKVD